MARRLLFDGSVKRIAQQAAPAPLSPLTARERAACARAALGESNKVIADNVAVAISTAGMLLLRARRKLRCRSREELIRRFRAAQSVVASVSPAAGRGAAEPLTPCEREIVAALLAGQSYAAIAAARGRSVYTVGKQVGRIFRKLGVGSRGELAARDDVPAVGAEPRAREPWAAGLRRGRNSRVTLRPPLQAIFDAIMAAHPDGLTLDQLSEELVDKPVDYADIDAIIGALEEAGVDLEAPEPTARPEELARVLAAARALAAETGRRPSPEEIAERSGLTAVAVRRALRFGRGAGA